MQEIYDYSDYRLFLRDHYLQHKATNPNFSFRYLAQKAGINSSGFYKLVIDGKRNLSHQGILKTCLALKLTDMEAEYFESLVMFNQAKVLSNKNSFFDRLIFLQKARNIKTLKENQFDYFDKWHHCIIREIAPMVSFGNDYAKLGKMLRPTITGKQARESIELLLRLGFLIKDGNHTYRQSWPLLSTGPSVKTHKIISFQIEMLKKAIDAFELSSPEERMNSSTTMRVSKKSLKKYFDRICELRMALMEMDRSETDPDEVYQLNMSFAPMTRLSSKVKP